MGELAAELDLLKLKCPQDKRSLTMGDEPSSHHLDISQSSLSMLGDEKEESEDAQDELARIKNDNYHLKLALGEQQDELLKLKRILEDNAFLENAHRFMPTKFEVEAPRTQRDPKYLVMAERDPKITVENSPSKKSISDSDFISSFSGSPYKGNRAPSLKTESSLASTRISKLREEKSIFHAAIVPFVQDIINSLKCSLVFKDEANDLQNRFIEYTESKLRKPEEIVQILNDVEFYCRQMVTLLNRELHFKEISQRLEFLFTIFLDPTEYGLCPQEHIDKLKDEIMDSLIKIFDYHQDSSNALLDSKYEALHMKGPQSHCSGIDHSKRLRHIEEGIDLCAETMQQVYGWRDTSLGIRSTAKRTQVSSRPTTKSDVEVLSHLSQFNNFGKDNHKQKENFGELEFIPIGYDENILQKAYK